MTAITTASTTVPYYNGVNNGAYYSGVNNGTYYNGINPGEAIAGTAIGIIGSTLLGRAIFGGFRDDRYRR